MHKQLEDSDHLALRIEMEKSDLVQTMPISSSATGRELIRQHQNALLNIPIENRSHFLLDAPEQTQSQRLFRGLLACLSGPADSDEPVTLHVWDIRRSDQPPKKILTISKPNIFDVVIEPQNDLLILAFYQAG